jgi:endonuclease/exonuclease/phosphatase family metal-dependent hydrolase
MFKVMTLNLNYYADKHGAWDQRMLAIRDALLEAEPDVVAFQAVKRDPKVRLGVDQAMQLGGMLLGTEQVLFQPAQIFADGSEHGSAVLSRTPITESVGIPLSLRDGLDDTNERMMIYACVDLPGGAIDLIDAHFSWNDEQAMDNVSEALRVLDKIEGAGLLLGDFNQTPDKPSMQRLRDAGWIDVWAALKPDQDGCTFESNHPSIRIDYIWITETLRSALRSVEIIAPYRADPQARFGDHVGLMATFDLPV